MACCSLAWRIQITALIDHFSGQYRDQNLRKSADGGRAVANVQR
jgi:hypothetical protein